MKKLLTLATAAIASAVILAGCAAPAPAPAPAPVAEPATEADYDTDAETEASPEYEAAAGSWAGRTIYMGTNAEFPPFEFIADGGQGLHGQYDGVDIAISVRIAEHLGAELEIIDMPFEGLIMALAAGQVDFVAAALTVTEERAQQVDFSIPYYSAFQTILVAADNDAVTGATSLYGMQVGVQIGTTGDFAASAMDNVEVLRYSRAVDAIVPLINGQIDAILVDSITAQFFYDAHAGNLRIVRDDEYFGHEQYAIAIGQGQPELVAAINEVLQEMLDSGEINALVAYYASN
ncbi:MAG: transporter substrate-binding domain-containing protein [Defluviitaleaceae bacterium]|nr:transporter substrate-binding domain-containing protein [Defluviitaleaceae bacterium]